MEVCYFSLDLISVVSCRNSRRVRRVKGSFPVEWASLRKNWHMGKEKSSSLVFIEGLLNHGNEIIDHSNLK